MSLGSRRPPAVVQPPPAPAFSVLTYNVNFAPFFRGTAPETAADAEAAAAAVAAIVEAGADVVLLQETNAGWEQALQAPAVAALYPFQTFTRSEHWFAGGSGVLSRTPLDTVVASPAESGWFDAIACQTVLPTVGRVQILNVHTRPGLEAGNGGLGFGALGEYQRAKGDRVRDMQTWLADAGLDETGPAPLPMVVGGDFNEATSGVWGGRLHDMLGERGFESSLVAQNVNAHTWRWPVWKFTVTASFDTVYFSQATLRCVGAEILQRGASDHLPVHCMFAAA